ncbi:coiled-coil domain-containing protein [Halostella salina]|uniref:hypothetical protein n=1 Tax=Halostella salina TaxID=1547897 RepID=UPI0013CF324F|nr:hypothetical protein [Halostella salina]
MDELLIQGDLVRSQVFGSAGVPAVALGLVFGAVAILGVELFLSRLGYIHLSRNDYTSTLEAYESNIEAIWENTNTRQRQETESLSTFKKSVELTEMAEAGDLVIADGGEATKMRSIQRTVTGLDLPSDTTTDDLAHQLSRSNVPTQYERILEQDFNALATKEQEVEEIRAVLDNVPLDDDVKPPNRNGNLGTDLNAIGTDIQSAVEKQQNNTSADSIDALRVLSELMLEAADELAEKESEVDQYTTELETLRKSIEGIFGDMYPMASPDAILNKLHEDINDGRFGKRKARKAADALAERSVHNSAAESLLTDLRNEEETEPQQLEESLGTVLDELDQYERQKRRLQRGTEDVDSLETRAEKVKEECSEFGIEVLSSTLKSRIDTVTESLDRSADPDPLDRFIASEKLQVIDDLVVDIKGRGPDEPTDVEETRDRLDNIKKNYIFGDDKRHSLIPQQFTNLAEELIENASQEASKGNADKAEGIIFGANKLLTTVRKLYQDPKPKDLLRRLEHQG